MVSGGPGQPKVWKKVKLLFVSADSAEVTRTVQRLLQAGIRCGVSRERWNSCHAVWLQDDKDFVRALRIWQLYARHRLPAS